MPSQNITPTVLPQYQADAYTLQRKQAMAQALMQGAMQPQQIQAVSSGPFTVMPKFNIGSGITQLGQALLANKLNKDVSSGYQDLGNSQAAAFGFSPTQSQGGTGQSTGQSPAASLSPNQGMTANQQPSQQSGSSQMNPLGLPPALAYSLYSADPAAYAKVQAEAFKPADIVSQVRAAGIDPNSPLGRQIAQQAIAKNNYIQPLSGGPGTTYRDPSNPSQVVANNPMVGEGQEVLYRQDGTPVIRAMEGAPQAAQDMARAKAAGAAAVEPITAFDQNNNPVFTNKLQASQGSAVSQGPSTGRFSGYSAPVGGGSVAPSLAPGVVKAAEGMADANTKRYGSLVDSAADSGARINVLDNILNLSKSGVATGPTQDWKNTVKGALADTLGSNAWKDDVSGFQEMKKYLRQNGLRAWQAAGGSGTDSQLSAAFESNPNEKMFPHALQQMAQWSKAGEIALQAKANAQDDWISRNNNNNPAAQNQFERVWRKNFDPRIYQMQLMTPGERAAFMSKQTDSQALKSKIDTAGNNGWIR